MYRGRDAREVFERRNDGSLRLLDGASDDGLVLELLLEPRSAMRFHLTYDGSLKAASRSNSRTSEKWDVRKHLEPQLAEFWTIHPALLGKQMLYAVSALTEKTFSEQRREQLRAPILVGGRPFIPLVRRSLYLGAALDILFLRKGDAGSVVEDGDLDNRLKVLLDGLTVPTENEMPHAGDLPEPPFHCLLEDDRLITAMAVRTGRLLTRLHAPSDEVRLIIDVVVSPMMPRLENSGFLGA